MSFGAARRFAATAAVLFACLSCGTRPARAAQDWRSLAGEWRLDPTRSELPDSAIKSGTRHLFFAIKGYVRGRIHKHLDPPETLWLSVASDSLMFRWHKELYYMLPGHPEFYYDSDDEGRATGLDTWEDGVLVNFRDGTDGTITRRFALSGDGEELGLTLTITSRRLPKPVAVRYTYLLARKP